MRAPFAYYGGKARLAPWILSHMPAHRVYLEPFFGSGAVLFAKQPAQHEIINDLDNKVVTFFRVLREQPEELEEACRLTPYSRTEFELAQRKEPGLPDLEIARRFWIRIGQSFACAGGGTGGWSISTFRNTHAAVTTQSRVDRFAACAERLASVSIECRPATEVIDRLAGKDALVYADPPYLDETRRGSRGGRSSDYGVDMGDPLEHKELAKALHSTVATVILSGYASPLYDELYGDWWTAERQINSSAGNRRNANATRRIERIWSNRDLGAGRLPGV